MPLVIHVVSFGLDGSSGEVRELADRLRALVEREWESGSGVQLVRGPIVLVGDAVDAAMEDQ